MESLPATDALLLTKIAQRDQSALSTLYDRYAKIIHAIAFKSLHSVEESEEVVLDVFSQVWRISDRYDAQKGRVDTWLFTLARSRILDRLRKLQRTTPSTTFSMDATQIESKADDIDLFQEAFLAERRALIITAMNKLPHEQRVVIELAYYQGFTQSQIARKIGIPLGTVKTRIRLGLSKLKSILANEQDL
ncbi:sigma-70 family RNA polymerase sigma factor [Nostoc commune]|uniref:sigma-70 family RNA polymerase sigma factor n=1 Tax=Nostoc commune TaxID=1178 RepID=UPI0018C6146B|nr:sigma-70 family RNA polymerase sigma factor [Nostoc commune]MBG1263284.1 sigma-70 family RNA polymerase sigma factor [Nostoc commune BAE]